MKKRTIIAVICAALAISVAGPVLAHDGEAETVTKNFEATIPNIPGKSITAAVVTYKPGGKSIPHRHGSAFVVAYEPIWAIGTGRTASLDEIGEMHGCIRAALALRFGEKGREARILYGGSMKPDNAGSILAVADVNGGLVGGAKQSIWQAPGRPGRPGA